jgi:hypothetical protein
MLEALGKSKCRSGHPIGGVDNHVREGGVYRLSKAIGIRKKVPQRPPARVWTIAQILTTCMPKLRLCEANVSHDSSGRERGVAEKLGQIREDRVAFDCGVAQPNVKLNQEVNSQ